MPGRKRDYSTVIAGWKQDIESVGIDINNRWTVWMHFKGIYGIADANPRVKNHPSGIYLFYFIYKAILEWTILGIRRQIDRDTRTVSLINFLGELKARPQVYGLKETLATFDARAAILARDQTDKKTIHERYEQYARAAFTPLADASGERIDPLKVQKDIEYLDKSCADLKDIANKYIAHIDRQKSRENREIPPLRIRRLDNEIAKIYTLARKYGAIMDGFAAQWDNRPIDYESLRDMFSFPWIVGGPPSVGDP